jgi:hypothetical protein
MIFKLLAKSSDAYFQFGYQDSKVDHGSSTMSQSIKTVSTMKDKQGRVFVLSLTSFKLNENIYIGQYFLSKQFHVNIIDQSSF